MKLKVRPKTSIQPENSTDIYNEPIKIWIAHIECRSWLIIDRMVNKMIIANDGTSRKYNSNIVQNEIGKISGKRMHETSKINLIRLAEGSSQLIQTS